LLDLTGHMWGIEGLRIFALHLVEELNKNPVLAEKLYLSSEEITENSESNAL